jgi:hypothetical protein
MNQSTMGASKKPAPAKGKKMPPKKAKGPY